MWLLVCSTPETHLPTLPNELLLEIISFQIKQDNRIWGPWFELRPGSKLSKRAVERHYSREHLKELTTDVYAEKYNNNEKRQVMARSFEFLRLESVPDLCRGAYAIDNVAELLDTAVFWYGSSWASSYSPANFEKVRVNTSPFVSSLT